MRYLDFICSIEPRTVKSIRSRSVWTVYITLVLVGALIGVARGAEPPTYSYRVINRFAHDPSAFTQGLIVSDGRLYESTGLYGQSTLREVEITTGRINRAMQLPPTVFGEGLALWNDALIVLTWQNRVAFAFDKATFKLQKQFRYDTEGWGLTQDGRSLIMSDGSSTLYFMDPSTFQLLRKVDVKSAEVPVSRLNELEYVNGQIYANVWQTPRIAIIDPNTGLVTAWLDLSTLTQQHTRNPDHVLNGIAYDALSKRLFVTGKQWNVIYEIEIVRPDR